MYSENNYMAVLTVWVVPYVLRCIDSDTKPLAVTALCITQN